MELTAIDNSRIVYLTQVWRRDGQLYLPDAITKVAERYSFIKTPTPDQQMPYNFQIGKFRDTQINEFGVYNDGFIVSSASDTDLLDAFIDDLMSWGREELKLEQLTTIPSEKFYESSVIVRSTTNLTSALQPRTDVAELVSDAMKSAKIDYELHFTGAIFDFDVAGIKLKRKPFRLVIDRRINVPFADNMFFSQAPFKTKDHLKLLDSLERASAKERK